MFISWLYSPECKGYVCDTSSIKYITCHVIFNESIFPYLSCFIPSDTINSSFTHDTPSNHYLTIINSISYVSASPSTPSSTNNLTVVHPLSFSSPSQSVLSPFNTNSSPQHTPDDTSHAT